jgi:hypothetical protein
MLSLLAENTENNVISLNKARQSAAHVQEIIQNLSDASTIAKKVGEIELHYLISIALEAAREKLMLQIYESS